MNYPKKIIKKIYSEIPEEYRDLIATPEIFEENDIIAKRHSLSIEQRRNMGDEGTLRTLGITPENNFVTNLSKRLSISEEEAMVISSDIKSSIFSKFPSGFLSDQEDRAQKRLTELMSEYSKNTKLEIAPNILPAVEEGEVAHDPTPEEKIFMNTPATIVSSTPTTPTPSSEPEKPKIVSVPQYTGEDPYREPAN